MKITTNKFLAAMAVGSLLAIATNSSADSQYGYNGAAKGVSAQAKVMIQVNVPELVILRVGDTKAIDVLKLNAQATVKSDPGLIKDDANNVAAAWDGAVPGFAAESQKLAAYVWTNAKGVVLRCESDDKLSAINLGSSKVNVEVDGDLKHPGTTTACEEKIDIPPNNLQTATWVYSISSDDLANAHAGTATQTTVYTAANI